MKQIGTKIYYCNVTGNIIKIIGDMQGHVKETTFDEDYEIYTELKEREKTSIGLIQLKYGEYSKLSKNSTGVRVNSETKELEFSYDTLPEIPQDPSEIDVVKDKIDILKAENLRLKEVEKEQDKMIMDNAYKMTILEANMGGI